MAMYDMYENIQDETELQCTKTDTLNNSPSESSNLQLNMTLHLS